MLTKIDWALMLVFTGGFALISWWISLAYILVALWLHWEEVTLQINIWFDNIIDKITIW